MSHKSNVVHVLFGLHNPPEPDLQEDPGCAVLDGVMRRLTLRKLIRTLQAIADKKQIEILRQKGVFLGMKYDK